MSTALPAKSTRTVLLVLAGHAMKLLSNVVHPRFLTVSSNKTEYGYVLPLQGSCPLWHCGKLHDLPSGYNPGLAAHADSLLKQPNTSLKSQPFLALHRCSSR